MCVCARARVCVCACRPKADSDAYLKMNAIGTVRPSLSCHDIVDEEIYVEPDQNNQPCDAVAETHISSHSVPSSTDRRSPSKSPHHQQLEVCKISKLWLASVIINKLLIITDAYKNA